MEVSSPPRANFIEERSGIPHEPVWPRPKRVDRLCIDAVRDESRMVLCQTFILIGHRQKAEDSIDEQ